MAPGSSSAEHNSGGGGGGACGIITDEEAHGMLSPFVTLGLLRPSQIEGALRRPLQERTTALQVLMLQGLRARQEQRKLCAECGKREGKLKSCSKCTNIWYCSKECQVANWAKAHRQSCAALKVARACRESEGDRADLLPEFERAYLKGLAGESIMQWPAKHIPASWPEFFQVRGIIMDNPSDALGVYNLVVSELLHEGLTCALAARRFGLLDPDAPPQERAFRLHILGAVDSEEVRRLPLTMGELGRLLVPHYYKGGLEVSLFGVQLSGTTPFPVPLDEALAPQVTVWRHRGYYHEWAAAQPQGEEAEAGWRPDMVVAFNSGAHTCDAHLAVDGSRWTPTLALLEAKGWPTVLTCYDHVEGEKTRRVVQGEVVEEEGQEQELAAPLRMRVAWGPELNPLRSLVLEEAEPPEAQRFGQLMMAGGGAGMGEAERAAAAEAMPLDLEACNHTSGCSRVWLGLRGRDARRPDEGAAGRGRKGEEEEQEG